MDADIHADADPNKHLHKDCNGDLYCLADIHDNIAKYSDRDADKYAELYRKPDMDADIHAYSHANRHIHKDGDRDHYHISDVYDNIAEHTYGYANDHAELYRVADRHADFYMDAERECDSLHVTFAYIYNNRNMDSLGDSD
jgi:hypothetical protein